jgi:hypothetical protein
MLAREVGGHRRLWDRCGTSERNQIHGTARDVILGRCWPNSGARAAGALADVPMCRDRRRSPAYRINPVEVLTMLDRRVVRNNPRAKG